MESCLETLQNAPTCRLHGVMGQERGDEHNTGEGGSINWHRVAGRTGFSVAKKGQRKLRCLKCNQDPMGLATGTSQILLC